MRLKESKFGFFYGCVNYPACHATHGAHRDGSPLGIPATGETRRLRIAAHEAFDALWQGPQATMTRREAYRLMRTLLGRQESQAHIALLSAAECEALIARVAAYRKEHNV